MRGVYLAFYLVPLLGACTRVGEAPAPAPAPIKDSGLMVSAISARAEPRTQPAALASMAPPFTLVGAIAAGEKSSALVQSLSGEQIVVQLGAEAARGWELRSVGHDTADFQTSSGMRTLAVSMGTPKASRTAAEPIPPTEIVGAKLPGFIAQDSLPSGVRDPGKNGNEAFRAAIADRAARVQAGAVKN